MCETALTSRAVLELRALCEGTLRSDDAAWRSALISTGCAIEDPVAGPYCEKDGADRQAADAEA